MSGTSKTALQRKVVEMERLLAQGERLLQEARTALAREIVDQPPLGTMIRFELQFSEDGPLYTYLAVRVGPGWYLTGSAGAQEWGDIVDLLRSAHWHGSVYALKVDGIVIGSGGPVPKRSDG